MVGNCKGWGIYESDIFDYVYNNIFFQCKYWTCPEQLSCLKKKKKCFSQHLLALPDFKVPQIGKYKLCFSGSFTGPCSWVFCRLLRGSSRIVWVLSVHLLPLWGDMESPVPPSTGMPLQGPKTKPTDWNLSREPDLWLYFLLAQIGEFTYSDWKGNFPLPASRIFSCNVCWPLFQTNNT